MGHEVHAIIAAKRVLPALAKRLGTDHVVPLPQGFGLIPVSERVFERLHPDDEPASANGPDGFLRLSDRLCSILARDSADQSTAYIETDFFGGTGTQRSAIWVRGECTIRRLAHTDASPHADWPINAALRALGVGRVEKSDEFDALGLVWGREDEDWELFAELGVEIPPRDDQREVLPNVIKAEMPDGSLYACPCCRFTTLPNRGGFEICPICYWEDDGQDSHDHYRVRGGPNGDLSLDAARENYERFGACDPKHREHVRPPRSDEVRRGPSAVEIAAGCYVVDRALRILHVSTRLILGGSQENTVLSCEGQARRGHEVHLAFGPIYGPEGSLLERVESFRVDGAAVETEPPAGAGGRSRAGAGLESDPLLPQGARGRGCCGAITTHAVPSMIRAINPVADVRCYFQLKRLIRAIEPDIVHTHSSKAGIIARAAAWAVYRGSKRKRPAVVHTIHGPPFHRYQSRLLNLVYTLAERFAARRCHTIVSVADAMTGQYVARKIGRREQYVTVRSGIETELFLEAATPHNRTRVRDELNLDEHDFVIGTVARLAELKGHDDLLDALEGDLRENPGWKLLWVGDGWWKDRLLRRVEELGLQGQVITTGLVEPGRVPDMIAAMDVLVHPSYREGLPRTVVQALLCGVCPIAYDVDGTGEICRELETGRLVRPGDIEALQRAVRWAARCPDERREMARRGQSMCSIAYSAQTMVQELEKVYADALERA